MNINTYILPPGLQEDTMPEIMYDRILNYIKELEGYKIQIKNLHWNAPNIQIHEQLDNLLNTLADYQDNVLEDAIGIYGHHVYFVINNVNIPTHLKDSISLIEKLFVVVSVFYNSLEEAVSLCGIRGETETLIHELNKFTYLFKLCK